MGAKRQFFPQLLVLAWKFIGVSNLQPIYRAGQRHSAAPLTTYTIGIPASEISFRITSSFPGKSTHGFSLFQRTSNEGHNSTHWRAIPTYSLTMNAACPGNRILPLLSRIARLLPRTTPRRRVRERCHNKYDPRLAFAASGPFEHGAGIGRPNTGSRSHGSTK